MSSSAPSWPRLLGIALAIAAAGVGLLGWSYVKVERSLAARAGPDPAGRRQDAQARAARDQQVTRARALLDAGAYPAAVAALDRALEWLPGDAEALALQVRAFRAQRQYTAARSTARRILGSFPESPLAHILLGSIAMQEGDTATARRDLERAVELDTSSALALAQIAALDLMEGRVLDARRRAEQALSLDPGDGTGLKILSRVSRSVPELLSIYRRLLEASPGDLVARSWLEVLERTRAPEVNYVTPFEGTLTIPCEADPDGRLFVRAGLQGRRRLRLLVDTGASGLVLSERLARRMGMRLMEFSESAGVGGLVRHSHPILVEQLDLGGIRGRALTATASNLPPAIDGIINPSILAPPGSGVLIELRPAQRALALLRGAAAETASRSGADRWVKVPFLADGHHIIFGIVLGGRPATALLDTGAAVDLLDRSMLPRFPAARILPGAASASLIGFGGRIDGAETLDEVSLRIAGRDFVTRRLHLVDLNEEAFRFSVDLDAVVGMGRLSAFDLRIDPTAGLLSFRPRDWPAR